MRATKLLLLLNDKFYENVVIPTVMEKAELFKTRYDLPSQKTLYGFADRNSYALQIGNLGFITQVKDCNNIIFSKHVINDGTGIPIGFQMRKVLKTTERYKIECVIQEFRVYYNKTTLSLFFDATSHLQFIDVGPVVGTRIVYTKDKTISLFEELHRYYVESQNLRSTNQLYKKIYEYYKNPDIDMIYIWRDAFDNSVSKGNVVLDDYENFNGKKYTLFNVNDEKIVSLKLILVRSIEYVEYVPTCNMLCQPKKEPEEFSLEKITRPVLVQPFETRRVSSKITELAPYISDKQFWVFLHEMPTIELVKKKIDEFEMKIINIVPEAIRFTGFENNIDYQLKNENGERGIETEDGSSILDGLIELQSKWKQDREDILFEYEIKQDIFGIVERIRKLILEIFLVNTRYIGYMLCNRYFTFDGRKTVTPSNYTKTGTFVHVTRKTGEKRPVEYNNPALVTTVFNDQYNAWYRGLWKKGDYEYKRGKFTEESIEEIDIEIAHFFDVTTRTESSITPEIVNDTNTTSFHYDVPEKDNVLVLIVDNGRLIGKLKRNNNPVKGGEIINFVYKTRDGDNMNQLWCKSFMSTIPSLMYETYSDAVEFYVIQHLSVSCKLPESGYDLYKHFKLLDVIKLNFIRFLGTISIKSSKAYQIGHYLLKLMSPNHEYVLKSPAGVLKDLDEISLFYPTKEQEGIYRILPKTGDNTNVFVTVRLKIIWIDIRSGKEFDKATVRKLFETTWRLKEYEKYGDLHGCFNALSNVPDSYKLFDFPKEHLDYKTKMEHWVRFKSGQFDIVLGSSISSYVDYCTDLHHAITSEHTEIMALFGEENTTKTDGRYYKKLFGKLCYLFEKMDQFNNVQPWYNTSNYVSTSDILRIFPIERGDNGLWWDGPRTIDGKPPVARNGYEITDGIIYYK